MFYPTVLEEGVKMLVETETSGAFMKSELEERPDPAQALKRGLANAEALSRYIGKTFRPAAQESNVETVVEFSIRLDGNGVYMIAQDQLAKQFPEYWYFGIGLLLIVVVLFARGGLLGIADALVAKLRGARA